MQNTIEIIQNQDSEKNFQVLTEYKIEIPLLEFPEYSFIGILDKIYYLEEPNQTLISIIDYKTGNPNLNLNNIKKGFNLQLPIYLWLLKNLPFKNIEPIGIYLQKILPSIIERDNIHQEQELKKQKLKLQGYSTSQTEDLMKFDPSYENSKLISSMKVSSKGFYSYSKVWDNEAFNKISTIAYDCIKTAIKEIQNEQYYINPKRIGKDLISCQYCSYFDICYREEKNIKYEKEENITDIIGGAKDNAELDERTN